MVKIDNAYGNLSSSEIDELYGIIIDAYARTEKEVWGEGYVRISKPEYLELIQRKEILFAQLDGEIVGGIHFFHLRDKTWTFSLLGTSKNHQGKGIGTALINGVEEAAKKLGGDRIHIEVLRAENISVKSKELLDQYYKRLGYDMVKTVDVFEVYNDSDKWSRLINPSVFDCYLKVF